MPFGLLLRLQLFALVTSENFLDVDAANVTINRVCILYVNIVKAVSQKRKDLYVTL